MGSSARPAASAGATPGGRAAAGAPRAGPPIRTAGHWPSPPGAHDHGGMANPIALSVALSRLVTITCPYCRKKKLVAREPKQFRTCPRCHKRFPDPLRGK
jgi:ribosomal protein S27E